MTTYFFDLDNTLCVTDGNNYGSASPILNRIEIVNALFSEGHTINIYTARGMTTYGGNVAMVKDNLFTLTETQLKQWNVKYTKLLMGKPSFDVLVDDKAINSEVFFPCKTPIRGLIVGCFDVLHYGYMQMFREAKKSCNHLIIALHEDPSIQRSEKSKPVFSMEERISILNGVKYIDEIIPYKTENDLLDIVNNKNIDIRFAGDDYRNKDFTGKDLPSKIIYFDRSHGWSSTKYKKLIYESFK